jgi:hypothetical protein
MHLSNLIDRDCRYDIEMAGRAAHQAFAGSAEGAFRFIAERATAPMGSPRLRLRPASSIRQRVRYSIGPSPTNWPIAPRNRITTCRLRRPAPPLSSAAQAGDASPQSLLPHACRRGQTASPRHQCGPRAPVAIRRTIHGLNDAASSDRSSASDRIMASVADDLPRVSRAIWTAPREAERTRRACGIRTQ